MDGTKVFLVSLILGIIATLLTGAINTTPGQLLGAKWYGFPAPWFTLRVLAPQYNPMVINYTLFIVDVILWTVVMGLVISGLMNKNSPSQQPSDSRRSRRSR